MATITFNNKHSIQQVQLYNIRGIVKVSKRIKDNVSLMDIYSVTSKRDYKILCKYFCPARRGDVISGICIKENNSSPGEFEFVQAPAVEPSCSRDSIQTAFIIALRRTGFSRAKSNRLYTFFEKIAVQKISENNKDESIYRNRDSMSAAVMEVICLFSDRFKTDETVIDPLMDLGLSKAQASKLLKWWENNFTMRRLYLLGLTKTEIRKSCTRGWTTDKLYYQLLENPYIVETVPMEKAQSISQRYNLVFSQNMIEAGNLVRYVDKRTKNRGWTCHPIYSLLKMYPRYRQLEPTLKNDYKCDIRYNCIYLKHQAIVENVLVKVLKSEKLPKTFCSDPIKKKLTKEQLEAVEKSLNNTVSIITGRAGTGKTTVISSLAEELELRDLEYIIGSFTGKAVSRLKEVVRRHDKIMTLHMMLNRNIQLEDVKYLIIDEISMVPNYLLGSVVRKLKNIYDHINIVLVGDPNQVQPIDAGDLFNQILMSNTVPTTHLTKDLRRNKNGKLKSNTTHFCLCEDPYDFIFEWGDDCEFKKGGIEMIENQAKHLKSLGVPHTEITIISPFNKDLEDINKRCQSIFLDEHAQRVKDNFENIWIVGTRVMMTKNRYDINVMNGEEGIVTEVSKYKPAIKVEFNNGEVVEIPTYIPEVVKSFNTYESKEEPLSTKLLKMSWAISIHKSQGSEWKKVIFYCQSNGKSSFLNRNLVYTGISRAKENLYVIGNSKDKFESYLYVFPSKRYDNLKRRLKGKPYTNSFVLPKAPTNSF